MRFGGDFVAIYCQSGGRREFFAPGPVASAVDLMQNSHLQLESLGGVRFEAEFAPGVPSLIYIESAKAD